MLPDYTLAIFTVELILLLLVGRLLGEGMSRLGQPALFGQLLAGVILGPSAFGAAFPELREVVFPDSKTSKSMIDAVSQIGILLLLLLTGMETNLSLMRRRRRAVISSSLSGIMVPFLCGVAIAYALPTDSVPMHDNRLVTALFLGTALSISSVKIVAMVLMETGAIRRDLGQLILATAILDDTLAWIIIAVISGIAIRGGVGDIVSISASVAGTALFLAFCLSIGRRLVGRLIVWVNDTMTIEAPVITAILVVMLSLSLTTDLIGVHTALGAFVTGVMVGQSPILTKHIEGQLRGFIMAFFSPVFFAVAGLGMDLRTLLDPTLAFFTVVLILAATLGKFSGAFIGGQLGGLTTRESLALATGLNARGSTEVIIASVGMSIGALSNQLYTMIVAVAVVTTMAMPPMLRWIMARVPLDEQESRRLEREEAEQAEQLPQMERALVYVDDSPNGRLAAHLAGLFAARRQMLTTVLEPAAARKNGSQAAAGKHVAEAASATEVPAEVQARPSTELVTERPPARHDALDREIGRGYDIVFIGLEKPLSQTAHFDSHIQQLIDGFDGPVAIAFNAGDTHEPADSPLDILLPAKGTHDARLATEVALALGRASKGTVAALHVFDPEDNTDLLRGRTRRLGLSVLVDVHRAGKRNEVPVKGLTAVNFRPEAEIQRAVRRDRYDLVVLGTSLRQGDSKFLGPRIVTLLRGVRAPILLIAR